MREGKSALRLTGFVESCLLRGTCSGEHAYSPVQAVARLEKWGFGQVAACSPTAPVLLMSRFLIPYLASLTEFR